jgi:hypothetical protein
MEITDKKLLSRFILSCAGKMVSRGRMTREYASEVINLLKEGRDIPEEAFSVFPAADIMLRKTASELGKDCVDRDVMLRYFSSKTHEKVIEASYKLHKDFDVEECKAKIGIVGGVVRDNVVVSASQPHVYKNTFSLDIKNGDYVMFHAGSIVEKLTKKEAELYSRDKI